MQNEIKAQGTEAKVCADIAKRQQFGLNKYGTSVADNPLELRDWLQHAYEESLDLPIYLKRAIDEIEFRMGLLEAPRESKQQVFDQEKFNSEYLTVISMGSDIVCVSCSFTSNCSKSLVDGHRPSCSREEREDHQEVYFIKKDKINGTQATK